MELKRLFDLTGRVAIVTGGSRGLGWQIAEALGEFGATIVLVARTAGALEESAARLRERGIRARAVAVDLRDSHGVDALVESVRAHEGRVDILVNNAGATWGAPAEDYPIEGWNKVMQLNVTAVFLLTQAVARTFMLPQRRGAIVNVASVEGFLGHLPTRVGTVAYNASKGAVVNLTRALAAEWGRFGLRVNALAPGFFPTKMTAATLAQSSGEALARTPLGRLGGPDDLKGAALLLASDAGAHITGHILTVDGGATAV